MGIVKMKHLKKKKKKKKKKKHEHLLHNLDLFFLQITLNLSSRVFHVATRQTD